MRSHSSTAAVRPFQTGYFEEALPLVVIFAFGALCLLLAVGGFSDYDDRRYVEAADAWLAHAPFIGTTHWHLRHPLVLSIAASFWLFGRNEFALMLPTILCYFGTLFLTFRMVLSVSDRASATLSAILVAATPLFPFYARVSFPDGMEVFLTVLSLWLFLQGTERDRTALLIGSGVVLGLAWILRATAAPLALLYGVLFLAGYRIKRYRYFLIGLGFVPVIAGEMLFYFAYAGDAFYRFAVDPRSLDVYSPAVIFGGSMHGLRPPFNFELMKSWTPVGPIHVHWLVDPYIGFFTNGNFGLIYYTGIWAAIVLCFRRDRSSADREFARLICLWSVLSLIFIIYVLNLRPEPRYFSTITWTMAVLTGLWLQENISRHRWWFAGALVTVILLSNAFLMNLRPDPLYTLRTLASYSETASEPIWIGGDLGAHSASVRKLVGVADRIRVGTADMVPSGELFFTTRGEAQALIGSGWNEVWDKQPSIALLATPFELVKPWLPARVWSALHRNYPEMVAIRSPQA